MGDTSNDGTRGIATSVENLPLLTTYAGPAKDKVIEALKFKQYWSTRDQAFERYGKLVSGEDPNRQAGLESMISNNAITLLSLSHFMVASSIPQRVVAVGDQGPLARRRAGKAERMVDSWWQSVDDRRMWAGMESWQYDIGYWMCLLGWFATLAMTVVDNGEPLPMAISYNPAEAYPEYSATKGIRKFHRIYETTLLEAADLAKQYGTYREPDFQGHKATKVTLLDEWVLTPQDEVLFSIIMTSNLAIGSGNYIKPVDRVKGLKRIPILCGPVGGAPANMSKLGSVLAENEVIYKDFDKWLSFLTQLVKEHAKAPIIAKNISINEEALSPEELRDSRAILETTDPEADIKRADVGQSPIDVFRFLTMVSAMEQRGGFPESAYGNLMFELSGFGISQLLQAAERRVGAQARRLARLDSIISTRWLTDFRDNEFGPTTIEGFEGNNPNKSFIENVTSSDVPRKFKVSTDIPLRIGNDLMTRMSVARQAVGGQEQLLDVFTTIDEILGMQDPSLIMDRISEDRTRTMTEQLRIAMNIKTMAADLRASKKPGATEAADMFDLFAESMLQQQQQAFGAQPQQRVGPRQLPPEARGVSPDRVRAAMRMGPPPNRTAQEQRTGVMNG